MSKLYGLGNYLISEMAVRLMTDPIFNKFVYYKDVDEDGEDILSLPDLESPIEMLTSKDNRQVHLHRRVPKILEHQDVNIFIHFDDQKNYNAKSNNIKTLFVKIGILVHKNCQGTPNGSREICIISAIERALDGKKFVKSLGTCSVDRIVPLYGLQVEYSGFEVICSIDGFPKNCGEQFEVEEELTCLK